MRGIPSNAGDRMPPSDPATAPPHSFRRRGLVRILAVVLLLPAFLLLLLTLVAATPFGARFAGKELSRMVGQPVTVDRLRITGTTLVVEGLAIGNLPPFPGNLLAVRSIMLVPSLRLLCGTPALALLEVRGGTADLRQDRSGAWNAAPLLGRFTGRPGGGESFIGLLRLRDASLRINGRLLPVREVTLRGLATRGSRDASWQISATPFPGSPVTLAGTFRPASPPAFSCRLYAPELALPALAGLLPLPPSLELTRGSASLHLTASGGKGIVTAGGTITVTGAAVRLKGRSLPLGGTADLAGVYRIDRDEAELTRGRIALDGLAPVTGSALVSGVRREREFSVEITSSPLELEAIRKLLLPGAAPGVTATGTVALSRLSLAGSSRQGVTSGRGRVALRNGNVAWQGRPFVQRMTADLSLAKAATGWQVTGEVSSGDSAGPAELRALRAGLNIALSPRFALLRAEAAPLSATVHGIGLTGRLGYAVAEPEPLSLRLGTENAPLAPLSPYLAGGNRITAGTADVTLTVTGSRDLQELHGAAVATLNGVAVTTAAGKRISVDRASLDGTFLRGRNRPPEGSGRISGSGAVDAVPADAACRFSVTPERLRLEGGSGRIGSSRTTFAGLQGRIPPRPLLPDAGIPVAVGVERLTLTADGLSLEGISGEVTGAWRAGQEGGGFTGKGDLTAGGLAWRSRRVTDLTAHLAADGSGMSGDLNGTGLGGRLAALLRLGTPRAGMPLTFTVSGRQLVPAEVAAAAGTPLPVAVTGGLIDADLTGSYRRGDGVRLSFVTDGSGLAVARNGRTLVSGLGVAVAGEYGGGDLRLRRGTATIGDRLGLTFSGEIDNLPATARSGSLSVILPETPLADLVNATAALLPAPLQELRTGGTLSLDGTIALGEGKTSLDGVLQVTGGEAALPSRQFSAEGIEGRVPVSLTFPSAGGEIRRERGFSRAGYPRDLALLEGGAGATTFRIGRARFGVLESGESRFQLAAKGGRTDLLRFETALYGGRVLGRGSVTWDRGPVYDADLLIHDLSLRRFCGTIPAITGYLSGKVDGVAGVHGERGGLDSAKGFFEVWARSASDEEMLVSREFLQKLAGKKLKGFFLRDDRPYDRGDLSGSLSGGYITFSKLDIAHTNLFGIRDLSVAVVPTQNRISLEHLISSLRTAARRGKPAKEEGSVPTEPPLQTEFKWLE